MLVAKPHDNHSIELALRGCFTQVIASLADVLRRFNDSAPLGVPNLATGVRRGVSWVTISIFLSGVAACHFANLMHDNTIKVLSGAPKCIAEPLISPVCAMELASSAHLSNVRQHQAGMLSGLHRKDRKLWGDLHFLHYFCPCIVPLRHI